MHGRLRERLLHGRCVRQCSVRASMRPPGLADKHRNLPVDSLKPLVHALLSQLPDDPSSIVITVKSENEPAAPANGQKSAASGPLYDPSLVYLLEFCTVLTLRDSDTVSSVGGDVAEALQNVMRNASSYHHIIISRTIFYLLHVLQSSYVGIIWFYLKQVLTHLGTIFLARSGCAPYYIKL